MSEESMNDFQAMLDASMRRISNGDMLDGTVLEVGEDAAVVDVGSYMDGILNAEELPAGESLSDLKAGQPIRVAVLKVDTRNSQILLSKKDADRVIAWKTLGSHQQEGEAVLVKVTGVVKGGLRVACGSATGFMPASQVDTSYVEDLTPYVGQELKAEILEVDEEKHDFTCSHKNVIRKEQQLTKEHLFETLKPGDKVSGRVAEIRPFGAFVEIENGVQGLIHVSDLSWVHVKDPSEVVHVGDMVETVVVSIDPERQRIGLSLKDAQPDPWTNLPFTVGEELSSCEVERIISTGAFVRVTPQIEGFLPISQISNKRIRSVTDVIHEHDLVNVKVLSVDPASHRLSLSMKESSEPEPSQEDETPEISFYSTDDDEPIGSSVGDALKKALGKASES